MTKAESDELEKIQNEAARIVSGATKLVSLDKLYDEVGWETLACRHNNHCLTYFFKMHIGLSPPYLSSLVPEPPAHPYNLRNAPAIPTLFSRTKLYHDSFLPATIRLWNNLPSSIKELPTVEAFDLEMVH